DPIKYFREFDIFLLPSREDPFPLVAIEAGMLGLPIICFEGVTGTAEILLNGGGKIIPYMDIIAMGKAVIHYYYNPGDVDYDGLRAVELFSNFTPNNVCPKIYKEIMALI